MTVTKHYRRSWVLATYTLAVSIFHEVRKLPENADVPLSDLARRCANTAVEQNASAMVGDKEALAQRFMKHCREHFGEEVAVAMGEQTRIDMQQTADAVQEARVM